MAKMVAMNKTLQWKTLLVVACCMLFSTQSTAESGNYRIEVLVFSHIDSTATPQLHDEIRSFVEYPQAGEFLVREAPVSLDVMSSVMQQTMRRLRSSANFHPIVFTAWEQSRIDYHPPVRVHDEEMIAQHLYFPNQLAFVDLRESDLFEDYLTPYYRLDGTVQLQRTRFLHLNLDFEYRQELLPRPELQDSDQFLPPSPGPAMMHSLEQSRQIRIDDMQYFDSPYLGVLVRVTATSGQ
jgi:hypothetical protein